ncbi:hypothetical protein [Microtetraspora glauca]|uniref:Acyl-ACP thioesterase-like C-terminal domain-containing protein n=1 Tax=Microtetraspora glauca TaxID=1996 RepID=A0ABV3GK63_MICGL
MTAPGDPGQDQLIVRYSDLDIAGHVNNVAWLRFVHIGVSRAVASWRAPGGSDRDGSGEVAWRRADIRYRRAVQAVGTPIAVRATPVERPEGLIVTCEVGAAGPDGCMTECVTADVFLGPPATTALEPDASSAHCKPGSEPSALTGRWPWSLAVPVRVGDRAGGGSLSPVAAADLLQEARHDALSNWRNTIRGRLIVARTTFCLGRAAVGAEIRLDSRCSRVGRAAVELTSRGVDPVDGAVVIRSTTRIARLMTDADRAATPWSDAERALLLDMWTSTRPGRPGTVAPIGHAPSSGCGQLDI